MLNGNEKTKIIFTTAKHIATFILLIIAIIYYFIPYEIEEWQVEVNSSNWKIPTLISENIQDYKLDKLFNISRYRNELLKNAINKGIPQEVMIKAISISDEQGPKKKIPVFIKTASKENIPIIIVVYKYQLIEGWNKEWGEQWFVVMQQNDGKIVMSDGTL